MNMRDEFEAWVKNPHMLHRRTEPGQTDEYEHPWIAGAWAAWKVNHAEVEQLRAENAEAREACPCVRMQDHFDDTLLQAVQFTVGRLFAVESENAKLAEDASNAKFHAGPPPVRSDCRPDERDMM